MPTATWKSRLRSGSAHCDLQLAVEVRQCPLGSGARGGGPAVPTGIWTARRRRRVRRRRSRRALLKSSNPHLAGGELKTKNASWDKGREAKYHTVVHSRWKPKPSYVLIYYILCIKFEHSHSTTFYFDIMISIYPVPL